MKRVLIVPQLQSHLLSAEVLENKLKQKSNYISYINTSNIYGYNFDKGLNISEPYWAKKKLYQYNGIKRNVLEVIYWHYNRTKILEKLKEVDVIIIFSEPSFIRSLVYSSKKWGIKTHLIMEGMRSENRLPISMWSVLNFKALMGQIKLRATYKLAKMFQSTRIYPFLPGLNGCTSVDFIYPLGEYSRGVISNIVAPKSKILPYGIPKYTNRNWSNLGLLEKNENATQNVLYITSAFDWHGKKEFAESQKRDLKLLAEKIDLLPNKSLFVRLHPKENVSNYEFLGEFQCFKGFRNNDSFEDIALHYGKIYANISTMIAELSLLGIVVRPILINFNRLLLLRNFTSVLDDKQIVDRESKLVHSLSENNENLRTNYNLIYNDEKGLNKLLENLLK
jgi:hypothetical protein